MEDPVLEAAALAAIKTKLDKKAYSLDFAREMQTYLVTHDLSQKEMAEKLGCPEKRPIINQVLGLLGLSKETLALLEGRILSTWDIKQYLHNKPPQTSTPPSTQTSTPSTQTSTPSTQTSTPSTNTEKNENNNGTGRNNGDRPDLQALGAPKNPFKHANRSEGGGESGDKTIGELIVSVLIGLAFVPAYLFCWLVKQRAYDDLCELEDRTNRRALAYGAWNVIRWVLVALLILVTAIALPRIRQVIHWLRHPGQTSTVQPVSPAPVAAPPTSGLSSPPPAKPREHNGKSNENRAPSPGISPLSAPSSGSGSAPLLNANDAAQLIQAGVPQNGGMVQRVGNALAVLAGKTITVGSPAAKKLAAGPQHLRWQPIAGSESITLAWDPMPGYHYNLYASPYSDHPSFDKDGSLVRSSTVTWTPPPHSPKIYLFYVTAVNSQGEESAPSGRLMVDNR